MFNRLITHVKYYPTLRGELETTEVTSNKDEVHIHGCDVRDGLLDWVLRVSLFFFEPKCAKSKDVSFQKFKDSTFPAFHCCLPSPMDFDESLQFLRAFGTVVLVPVAANVNSRGHIMHRFQPMSPSPDPNLTVSAQHHASLGDIDIALTYGEQNFTIEVQVRNLYVTFNVTRAGYVPISLC